MVNLLLSDFCILHLVSSFYRSFSIGLEITGLNQAKENIKDKEQNTKGSDDNVENRSYNPITGQQFKGHQEINKDNVFGSNEYRSAFFKTMLGT